MDSYRANPKSNAKPKNPSTATAAPGFDSLYSSLFGSGDRQNFNTNPATAPSANETLYPSSPYQPNQMPTSPQVHSGSVGQTRNELPYATRSTDKWHHPSRPSPALPQHQEEPYSIGPFDSIWSMKSSEMAGANVQHQQKPSNWSSDTTAAAGYCDPHAPMSATNGLPFGGYDQHAYEHNDAGFHGDSGGVSTPGYAWSTHDGVNDANVSGLADWHWNQGEYSSSVQSGNLQSGRSEVDGNMESHGVNEWELHDEERERKIREEDMKGRQERREWKKKGINHPELVLDGSVHKHKSPPSSHPKTSLNDKVVASFLEKYRDTDHVAPTPGSSIDINKHVLLGTEVRESQFEELGPAWEERGNTTDLAVKVQPTDGRCHISGKGPSPEPERCDPTEEHQETTSNVDSSDLVDRMEAREVRSLSDPVTVQEAQENNNVKSGTASRKVVSNGKIRPGKRKPKLPRDKRRNIAAQADKSETQSCEKQTVQIEIKEQPESIEQSTHLDTKGIGLNPNPSPKSFNSISSEHIVQSPKPTPLSRSIPKNTGGNPAHASKAQTVNSNASCQEVPPKDHVSDIKACCPESSICYDCACTTTCDSKTDAPSRNVSPPVPVKGNIATKKDCKSSGLSRDMSAQIRVDASQSRKSLETNHVSPKSSERNVTSSSCVNDLSTAEKVVSSDHRTQRKNSTGTKNVQQQNVPAVPLENHAASQKDSSTRVRGTVITVMGKSPTTRKKDITKGMRPSPVQNQIPSCEPNSNSTNKNLKLTDEVKSVNSSKLPTTTGSSKQNNDKSPSGLMQGQEKKNTKDSGLFFDPKRIFGGQKTVKSAVPKLSKEAEKSTKSTPADRSPKSSHSTDSLTSQVKEMVHVHPAKSEQCSVLPDPPVVQRPANPTKSVRSGVNEGMVNGTVPGKDLPRHPAQSVPSSSAKDALASKASAMKAEPVSSQHRSGEPTSPSEPRPPRMYSYKKDDQTGALRRSSDPKVEEATKYQSPRRDSSGNQSASDEARGEGRCSGESHMDGFHHPFGCSAQCYRKSSSPSSSRSSSNSRQASSSVNQSTGCSASSEKKDFSQTAKQNAPHVFPQPENSSPVFEASAFAELREGLKNSWLSKEKEKQREDEKQRQDKVQKEHLERVQELQQDQRRQQEKQEQKRQQEKQEQKRQQEKQEQKKQQEKQEQKKQQEKRQASASHHVKRPTRATYSKAKEANPATAEHEAKDKRTGASEDRPGARTSTQQPRSPWPDHTEPRPQEDSNEESDMEEDLTRGITDEWWFKLGKKFGKGLCWLVLFTLLLCLVLLSFLLALARDTCKFAYHRGWDLWAWYTEKPPQDDEFFSSHRSHQRDSGFSGSHQNNQSETGGSWFFGSGRSQQGETGGGGGSRRSWSHTGASGQQQDQGATAKEPRKKQTQNIELPSTELAAIRRLLGCDPGNYYEVVGVAEDASEEDIKKFYRKQCMLVHPDKTDQPRANEAFQVLQKAYAILSDPTKRNEYHSELDYKEHLEDKVKDLYKKMAEMADSMPCGVCMQSHKRYETNLPVHAARYCTAHDTRHPVKDGALWKETANLGFKIYVFLCDEHTVFDVTEWAACQNLDWLEANACRLLCKVKRGGRTGQQRRQQHTAGYEEMFDDIFGSGAFRQFQSSANQQGHHGNSHPGNGHHASSGSSHGQSQQGGGSRNKGVKKSRKKKK